MNRIIINFVLVAIVLAFVACEQTIFVGGTATDFQSGDSIEGLEMGLYAAKAGFDYEDKKWSDLELIASATSNSEGFFSMEIDEDMDLSHHVFYFPLPPIDTLSANAKYKYSTSYDSDFMSLDYSASGEFRLGRSSNVWVKLINFTQEEIKMQFADGFVSFFSGNNYSEYLYFNKILSGQNHKLDFYEIIYVNSETYEKELEYLGSTSRFIKTQLPDDSDKVEWFMPLQTIEIDFNTLEK